MEVKTKEKKKWDEVNQLMTPPPYIFGAHRSYNIRKDPKCLGFALSRYKFAAKMAVHATSVLELGCSDGIGANILAEHNKRYVGIDLNAQTIEDAKLNHASAEFVFDDFMGKYYGSFGAVVSLDVVEHLLPAYEEEYFTTVWKNTASDGIAVVGTPNITAAKYASEESNLGHVNLFSQSHLVAAMRKYYQTVFAFGMNDEILHTGYSSMCHYIMCIGCNKYESRRRSS